MKKIALMLAVVLLCGCQSVDLHPSKAAKRRFVQGSPQLETRAEGDGNPD